MENKGEVVIYQTEDGLSKLEVNLDTLIKFLKKGNWFERQLLHFLQQFKMRVADR